MSAPTGGTFHARVMEKFDLCAVESPDVELRVEWVERHGWWDDWFAAIVMYCPCCKDTRTLYKFYRGADETVEVD